MVSPVDTCFLTLGLVSALMVVSMDARSWDIAVAMDQRIAFLAKNGTEVGVSEAVGAKLWGLAYDNVTRTMYVSDLDSKIPLTNNSEVNRKDFEPYTALKQIEGHKIRAIVFDPVGKTLFWPDNQKNAIMKMQDPSNGNSNDPEVLHDLKGGIAYGIAIDICNRFIFWSNSEAGIVRIERSNLDGSDRKVVVNDSLFDVSGLAVDHSAGKLYWIDDLEGIKYNIERSNYDGKERVLFANGTHHEPLYIAVDNESVYWTDSQNDAVWKKAKNQGLQIKPKEFKSYYPDHRPRGIITWDNIGDLDCNAILKAQNNRLQNPTTPKITLVNSLDNPITTAATTSKKIIIPITHNEVEKQCLNNGLYDPSTASCICKEGFSGLLCEVLSSCHNYCIHGSCTIDDQGTPKCSCDISYTGNRCEKDPCDGYCMNNGTCSITSSGPNCKCENFEGSRCEYATELDKFCSIYCKRNDNEPTSVSGAFCKCSGLNETWSQHLMATEPLVSSTVILSVLIALVGALTIVVGVLSYHINKLRRRPRIRKRFVVSKGGVTPLTSRPQVPSDSCEITIENCCNMNICETPCFEPKLRSTTPTKSSSKKTEEKNSLLDSMEGADSC